MSFETWQSENVAVLDKPKDGFAAWQSQNTPMSKPPFDIEREYDSLIGGAVKSAFASMKTPDEAEKFSGDSLNFAIENKIGIRQAEAFTSFAKLQEHFQPQFPPFEEMMAQTAEMARRYSLTDEGKVQQHIDALNGMSKADRTDMIKFIKLGDFFGVLPYLSNEGYLKLFGVENDVGELANMVQAANYVASQTKLNDLEGWNYLTSDLLRTVLEFETTGIFVKGATAKFALQEALQFPSESKTWGELLKEKGISVPKAALTGYIVGKTGQWIKNPLIRTPIVATGFAGMSYQEAKSMGMSHEEALEAAKKSVITIFGFEAIGIAQKILTGKSTENMSNIVKAVRKWDSKKPKPTLTNMSDKEVMEGIKDYVKLANPPKEPPKAADKPSVSPPEATKSAKPTGTAPPAVGEPAGKRSWEMTVNEWGKARPLGLTETNAEKYGTQQKLAQGYKWMLEGAIKRGESVPPEVLAEYPDLAKQAPKPPEIQPTIGKEGQRPVGKGETAAEPTRLIDKYQIVETPINKIKLSTEVPNFKEAASKETGVIKGQELQGKYERLGTGAVILWERNNGDLEVITGRHRFELAKRTGEKTIPAQIVREKDGWNKDMALTIDAESNIRDLQGEVRDYAQYFRNTKITEQQARERGLLSRVKGKVGFVVGKSTTSDVYSAFLGDKITEQQAAAIGRAAPNNESIQAAALAKANRLNPDELEQYTAILARTKPSDRTKTTQGNLFGFNESVLIEAESVAKQVVIEQQSVKERILAVKGALRRPDIARKMGLEFSDEKSIRKEVERLETRLDELGRVSTNPKLYQEMRTKAGLETPVAEKQPEQIDQVKEQQEIEQIYSDAVPPTDVPTKVKLQSAVAQALNEDARRIINSKKKYKGVKDEQQLYDKEFSDQPELFINPKNPIPEMQAAWTIAIKGKGLFGNIAFEPTPKGMAGGFAAIPEMPSPEVIRETVEGFYQDTINKFASIENTMKKAKELGLKVKEGEDAGVRAREYLSMGKKVQTTLEDNTYKVNPDGTIETTGKGLRPILKDIDKQLKPLEPKGKIREKDFFDFLDAQRTIQDLQRPAEGKVENIASPEQVAKAQVDLDSLNKKYGANISIMRDSATRLYDFQKRILHLLVDSGNLSEERFGDIVLKNPHYIPFDRILEPPVEGKTGVMPVSKGRFTGAKSPVKRIVGSELEKQNFMVSVIKNTYRIMDVAERNTIWKDIYRCRKIPELGINDITATMMPIHLTEKEVGGEAKTTFRPSQFKPKGNVLEGFVDGKRKYIEVDKNLYQAMSGLNETSANIIGRILAKPTNWLRTGATITPEFILRNPFRDQWTALMQTSVGFRPFIDSASAIADILGKSETYKDWMRSGGAYSGFVELSRPALEKTYKNLMNDKNLLKRLNIITDLKDLSQLMEQATRVGVYKAAVRAGKVPVEAGFISREATVDFAVKGAQTKDIDGAIAFFRAGINGTRQTVKTFRDHPVATTVKGIASITIPSLLFYLKNRNDPEYQELPRWERDLFWVTKVNNTWVRIPKPFLYGQVFGSTPERFFEYLDSGDPKSFDELAQSLLESATPISGDIAGSIIPTAVKPWIENTVNWNWFMQRNIVPEGRKDLLPPEQFTRYTTQTAKELGEWFNYSPAKIENLIRGYFGGSGQYALQGSDVAINQIRKLEGKEPIPKRPTELSDIPLIKGFVARKPKGSESIQRFYADSEKIIASYASFQKAIKEGRPEDARKYKDQNPQVALAPFLTKVKMKMSEYMSLNDFIIRSADYSVDQKRKLLDYYDNKIANLAQKANKIIDLQKVKKLKTPTQK